MGLGRIANSGQLPTATRIVWVFAELIAHPEVTETVHLAGRVGVMALHGALETGTETIAQVVADQADASLYMVTQSERLRWHVPSTNYDPTRSPALATFLDHVDSVVSIHGFGREHLPKTALVGGGSQHLVTRTQRALEHRTSLNVVTGDAIPEGLRGLHPSNPVNLASGGGVQLELSHACRHAPHVTTVIEAICDVVNQTGI